MAKRLPVLYALLILMEIGWLSWLYLTDQPSSSSTLSIGLGWAGLLSMVIMLIYSVARRSRSMRQVARLSYWLHFHIFLGVQGVVCVIFHSMHLFTRDAAVNWLNPAVLNFLAVLVVFCSGVFGRYLYSLLPRTLGGEQMAAREVEAEIAAMSAKLPAALEGLWKSAPGAKSLPELVRADIETRRVMREVKGMNLPPELFDLASRRVRLERRLAVLSGAERIFRRWIVLHRPIASMMYVLSAVHVALSYMFTPSLGN